MQRTIHIGDDTIEFEHKREGDIRTINMNGTIHSVQLIPLPDGRTLGIVDGVVVEWEPGDSKDVRFVHTRGHLRHLKVVDPRKARKAGAAAGLGAGSAEISAPMPGKVVQILVEKGAKVEAGDGIVVLEAMKMENELRAPAAGIVTRLDAEVGTPVEQGRIIAIIEPESA